MKNRAWFALTALVVCLTAAGALGQCCPALAKKAADKAQAETAAETKEEAKPAVCGMAGTCGISAALAKLDLTEEQKTKIAAITKETGCAQKPAEGACPKALQAKRKACKEKIMALLTDEQKAQAAKLCPKSKCAKKDG